MMTNYFKELWSALLKVAKEFWGFIKYLLREVEK